MLKSSRFANHRRHITALTVRSQRILLLLLIFLVAAFARLWQFQDAPPGLQHDELFKAQEGRAIVENGDWRFFYPSNQGHEGGYVWLLALSYLLFGSNLVMIKMPPFWVGLLTLAWLYRFVRDSQNERVALIATSMAAVSFWMISTNRVGLRANLLPLVTLIVLWGLWRVCFAKPQQAVRRWRIALLTGVVLGFAIYTYTASFALYVAVGLFLLGLALFDRATLRERFPELALIVFLGLVLTLPMLNARLSDPQGQNRVSTISEPWDKFKDGDPGPLLDNARLLLTMPVFSGDPEWRYNLAERPLFLPPIGVMVYAGFLLMLWHSRREPLNIGLLALALIGLIPSLLTISAPSYLRSIIVLPSVMIFIAVSIDWLRRFRSKVLVWSVAVMVIAATLVADWNAYFNEWPRSDEVHAIYRDDLEQLAAFLRQSEEGLALVSTSEPAILDPAIFSYLNPPVDADVVFFDGGVDVVLNDEPTLLFVSPGAPISPAHMEWLTESLGTVQLEPLRRQDGVVAFEVYRLAALHDGLSRRLAEVGQWSVYDGPSGAFPSPEISEWGERLNYPVNFGDVLQLVGVEMPQSKIPSTDNGVDNGLQLQLYLQPRAEKRSASLSLFVHFVSMDGEVVFGRDFLGVPASTWSTDITFIQDNYLGNYNISPGRYFVAMGLYETRTGERFPILNASGEVIADQIMLGQFDAQ